MLDDCCPANMLSPHLTLLQASSSFHMLEHVASWCKLHGNCEVLFREKHLSELYDVRVKQSAAQQLLLMHCKSSLSIYVE